MRPRMDATLAALKKEEAERNAAQARAARIAQCSDIVARVKEFLAAHWSLANGIYAEECPAVSPTSPRCPRRGLC